MMESIHPLRAVRESHNLSLKDLAQATTLSERTILRIEQGESPHPSTRRILCKYFGMSARELGLLKEESGSVPPEIEALEAAMNNLRRKLIRDTIVTATTALVLPTTTIDIIERITSATTKPSQLDKVTLTYLEDQMPGYWDLLPDRAGTSSSSLLNIVEGQLKTITQFLLHPQPSHLEKRLWNIVAELYQIAGQMAFDMHNLNLAAGYYRGSVQAGQQCGNDALTAAALTRISFLPTYDKRPECALPYQEEARRLAAHSATPTTQAWIAAVEAEAHAALGNTNSCQKALGRAEQGDIQVLTLEGDPFRTGFDRAKLGGYMGACYTRVKRPQDALKALQGSLSTLEGTQRIRYQSIVITDIAVAYGQQGEPEEAYKWAKRALVLIQQTKSTNVLKRVQGVQELLPPETAKNLEEEIISTW